MRVPALAVVLGVLGLVPFAACGLLAATGDAAVAPRATLALIGYGAIILGFLGGVHWGFAMPVLPASTGLVPVVPLVGRRMLGGVLPALAGWGAVVLAAYGWDAAALAVLIVAFIALIIAEVRANRAGLMPAGYIWLRWGLTAGVLLCLVSVAILRVAGGNIVL